MLRLIKCLYFQMKGLMVEIKAEVINFLDTTIAPIVQQRLGKLITGKRKFTI